MEKVVNKLGSSLLLLVFFPLFTLGQAVPSPLKRKITGNFESTELDEIFSHLENEGKFHFSYNPDLFPMDSIVQLNLGSVSLKKVLDNLFDERTSYKEVGNYVILRSGKENEFSKKENSTNEEYIISGYLIDRQSGQKIRNASVYQIDELNSTLTDPNGYYSLMVSSTNQSVELSFSRKNYLDTLIVIEPESQNMDVVLTPRTGKLQQVSSVNAPIRSTSSNVENVKLVKFVVPEEQLTYANNMDGLFDERLAQISFLPILGSNNRLSGLISNNLSVNVLAGYNAGVKGLEIGGLVNIVRKDVRGLQIGGLSNIVGGKINGSQVSGFINNCRGSISGIQIAGFNNLVLDTIVGIQIAGFTNIVKGKIEGVQIAGFGNITTQNVDGVEVAGFFNIAFKDVKKSQLSGFFNYGRNTIGTQISGFANLATGKVVGAQVGGFLNISAKEVEGLQLSGFLNYAKKVKSLQLGFINISDSCEGIPIGFLSFVRRGFNKLELYSTEVTQFNVSYKTGIRKFHNIISLGVGRRGAVDLWGFGYGFGTFFKLNSNRLYMNIDVTANHISFNDFTKMFTNTLYKFNSNLNYRISKRITLLAGPSFNMHIRDMIYSYPEISESYTFEDFRNGVKFRAWFGFHLGVRF